MHKSEPTWYGSLILFCDADVDQILHVWMLLLCFQAVAGLKVYMHKSEIVPIGEVNNMYTLAKIWGCRVGTCLGLILACYWGLLISHLLFGILFWKKLSGSWPGGKGCIGQKVVD